MIFKNRSKTSGVSVRGFRKTLIGTHGKRNFKNWFTKEPRPRRNHGESPDEFPEESPQQVKEFMKKKIV